METPLSKDSSYSVIFLSSILGLACVPVSWLALFSSCPNISLCFSQEQEKVPLKHRTEFCYLATLHSRAVVESDQPPAVLSA